MKYRRDEALSNGELLKIFDEADVDGSGTLTWDEFNKALTENGIGKEFIEVHISKNE